MKYIAVLSIFFIGVFSVHAYVFQPAVINGREYISLNDICEIFNVSFHNQFFPNRIVLTTEAEETIVLLISSQRMLIGKKIYNLEYPPEIKDGVIFIPVGFISRVFGEDAFKSIKEAKKSRIETIVIDAGHGGWDPGAIGPNGLMEKEVNLDIAKKVRQLLNLHLPVKVLMTREEDTFVSLAQRAKFANDNGANLFVSIHCNAAFSTQMHGVETYFVSEAESPEARAVEVLENSVINLEIKELGVTRDEYLKSVLQPILEDMIYHEFVRESSAAACCIQKSLVEKLKLYDRGVKTALFYVLRGVGAPSILVEVAFLSNPEEESNLASESFRNRAAEAIFEGIKEFLHASRKIE